MQPQLGAPGVGIDSVTLLPARKLGFDLSKGVGVRVGGATGDSRAVDPFVERHGGGKLAAQVGKEIIGCDALKREVVEVGTEKCVEARAPHFPLDSTEQQRAFFVGDEGAAVVGVAALETDVQDA